jgi:hypothetical protein
LAASAASAHSRPSRAISRNWRVGEPVIADIELGRGERWARASVFTIDIAVYELQHCCCMVFLRREHGNLALNWHNSVTIGGEPRKM